MLIFISIIVLSFNHLGKLKIYCLFLVLLKNAPIILNNMFKCMSLIFYNFTSEIIIAVSLRNPKSFLLLSTFPSSIPTFYILKFLSQYIAHQINIFSLLYICSPLRVINVILDCYFLNWHGYLKWIICGRVHFWLFFKYLFVLSILNFLSNYIFDLPFCLFFSENFIRYLLKSFISPSISLTFFSYIEPLYLEAVYSR